MVVLDVFVGESNPHHLFTQESFSEIKKILTEDGVLIINGNGFWNGEAGRGMRSICNTLLSAGFSVTIIPTGEKENYRNLEFVATKSSSPRAQMNQVGNIPVGANSTTVSLTGAVVLTDEKPQLEILNAEANKRWREMCIKYFLSGYYSQRDVLIFK